MKQVTVEEFRKKVKLSKVTEGPDGKLYEINCDPLELVNVAGDWLLHHIMQAYLNEVLSTMPGRVWTSEELHDRREACWDERDEYGARKRWAEVSYGKRKVAEGLMDLADFVSSREHKGIKTTSEDLQIEWDRRTAEVDEAMKDESVKYRLSPAKEQP